MIKRIGQYISIEKIDVQDDYRYFIDKIGSNPKITKWMGSFNYGKLMEQQRKSYYYFIVYIGMQIVGLVAIDIYNLEQKLQSTVMYVIDEFHQGKSYGFLLLSEISNYLLNFGVEQINLYIDLGNKPSRRVAIKNGYQQVTEKRYIKVQNKL